MLYALWWSAFSHDSFWSSDMALYSILRLLKTCRLIATSDPVTLSTTLHRRSSLSPVGNCGWRKWFISVFHRIVFLHAFLKLKKLKIVSTKYDVQKINAKIEKCVHYFVFIVVFSRYSTIYYWNIYLKLLTAVRSGPRSCGQMYDVR